MSPRKKAAKPPEPTLVERVNQLAAFSNTDYFVAANGDVYRNHCPCERHLKRKRSGIGEGHDATPVGNISKEPDLAARLGLTARGAS